MTARSFVAVDESLAELLRSWIKPIAAPEELAQRSSSADLPLPPYYRGPGSESPGEYPFTRGRTARMYHDGPWVMGQYSGYATPTETNARFKQLLEAGGTGLSIALDLPTQLGLDSDHPLAEGEVGKVGVPIDTVEDMLLLLGGLPLERVQQLRTTANAIGPFFTALLLVALEELDADPATFRLLLQNDPLKEFTVRGTFIFAPRPSVGLAVDVIEYFAAELPHWEPITFCGYHFRDAGGTAVHEMGLLISNGIEYLDAAARRGVDIDVLAQSLFVFLSAGLDIFEEAAKFRATRRIWAHLLHERYGVPREAAGVNVFSYTLGGQLTAQEPLNNVVRVAYEALAAALGGAQTLATSSYDEAIGLPSAEAVHLSLRTQQILAYESGVTKVVDPLAGSYYVEDLTDRLEAEALGYVLRIVEQGGALAATESGLIAREIADSAYQYQLEVESGSRPIVGVSIFPAEPEAVVGAFTVSRDAQATQLVQLAEVKAKRSDGKVRQALSDLTAVAEANGNTIPVLMEAARARATLSEMVGALATVHGRYAASQTRL